MMRPVDRVVSETTLIAGRPEIDDFLFSRKALGTFRFARC
jgi:hypothetical protein